MPEQHREKRGTHVFTLTAAFDAGYLVRARCMVCNIRRVYDPADLKQLVGDIGCEELCRRMRCEQCRQGGDNMDIEFWYPTAQERQGLVIRRLVGTRMIRKVIWRDEQAP